jgi:nucleoside-diphosphate-sugar epimerase
MKKRSKSKFYKEIVNASSVDIVDLSALSGKKVLITGASGVIGFNLLYQILSYPGYSSLPAVTYQIRSDLPKIMADVLDGYDNLRVIQTDFSDLSLFEDVYDYVIHAATYGQPGKYVSEKLKTIELNTTITMQLLKRVNSEGGKFLFLSSSDVYAGSQQFPTKEVDLGISNPWHTRSSYFEGKRCGEAICSAYLGSSIEAKVARVSLGYGPGFKLGDKRVMYEFVFKALREKKITLKDAGHASRTYCYMTDLNEQLLNILLNSRDSFYNASGNSRITIYGLASLIGDALGVPVVIPDKNIQDEQTLNAPEEVWLSNEKYNLEFGKSSYISIENGIESVIKWANFL